MKHLSLALIILASTQLFAVRHTTVETSPLVASATVSQRPEFINITIDIRSECYLDRDTLVEATNRETNRIQDVINTMIVQSRNDKSCITGGIINDDYYRQTGWGEDGKRTCVGTFAMNNTITIQYYDVEGFADFYNQLNRQLNTIGNKALEEPYTNSKIYSYAGDVSETTRENMIEQALANAKKKACHRFETTSNNAAYTYSFTDEASSLNNNLEERSKYAEAAPKLGDNNTKINLNIPNIEVTKTLKVIFKHNGLSNTDNFDFDMISHPR